ncbi:unnamed protein product [Linum trigynum]|uniref:Uncharacterized protein n=1 Tax=Linum trigynum TaxID=586398 RepID=A0AAV2EVB8_9ROSI
MSTKLVRSQDRVMFRDKTKLKCNFTHGRRLRFHGRGIEVCGHGTLLFQSPVVELTPVAMDFEVVCPSRSRGPPSSRFEASAFGSL